MKPQCCIKDIRSPLVLDASVIINLVSSGHGQHILELLPNECLVLDEVLLELNRGMSNGRDGAPQLEAMLKSRILTQISLDPNGYETYESLVSGKGAATIDDGEASTIAHAEAISGTVVLDERKATKICHSSYPQLPLASTVDLFAHPTVHSGVSEQDLKQAVLNALIRGRMNVKSHHEDWVLNLLGIEQAQKCNSLRKILRKRGTNC